MLFPGTPVFLHYNSKHVEAVIAQDQNDIKNYEIRVVVSPSTAKYLGYGPELVVARGNVSPQD
jgi:hypothetical protein